MSTRGYYGVRGRAPDPHVARICSHPFRLHWRDDERERRHAPDYFVRCVDGSAAAVDVRADERIEPKDAEAFEVTRPVRAQAGWRFERLGTPGAVLLANVRWLSRYRHPRYLHVAAAGRLREVFATPGLVQWAEQYFSTHKLVAYHRSRRIVTRSFPAKPPRQPGEADAEALRSPLYLSHRY
ncbi:TnsA-like heteromeric transposase endonuclease subunit [Streptomyces sp. NPDC101151]|uniref:TnsA-like heteromeric transposase endonuclease subunit n=1 Tax=Streptomyces sp. NPDC101151 TaxID=3366115 RepID=UPI00380C22E8